ncbi:tectonic-like complex member MKS1 isoform X1 [Cydia pomonella]|uniref:tectonic-like complex member MKS1 isoform X1 n=1 Tax=Cydia pomonella TaxID=82600 RepID=UPI002ADE4284|nr:tectonic-like complex member MKS1 isoform X1 [Cydia pomonella]
MNNFDRSNKVTGVYWLKSPIENITIKIRLKPHEGIKTLPKFETYNNDRNNTIQQVENNKIEEYEFKWQEKAFSLHEIQRYSDIHNCISENELSYHDLLEETDYQPDKVFTYIHHDYHLPMPVNKIKKSTSGSDILNLNSCFEKLNLSEKVFREDTSSMAHLFRSEESIASEEKWTSMHVMYDNSEYNENSQLLLKQEITLLSLYHNVSQNYLIVSPDVNSLDLNPYQLEQGYEYAVDVEFERMDGEELLVLLKKLSKKWEKRHKQLLKFVMPPLGRRHHHVTLEILSATDFDLDNLYVEFYIKVPEELQCSDALHGRTHISKSNTNDSEQKYWSFGHLVELTLDGPLNTDTPPLKLFFEIISTDWWGRQRTEGYCYLPLTLQPGRYSRQLSCSRPEELNHVAAESRRFFVGGCHLIKDLEVLAKPQLQDANFKFTTTGTLSVRWSTITQSPLPGFKTAPSQVSHASALLRGAEAVLRQYKRARDRLAEATRDLNGVQETTFGSDDD